LTETEVIRMLIPYLKSLFPKRCPVCLRQFFTFREYLLNTTQIGSAMSYDAELGNWHPLDPIGTAILANCSCGNTLTLSCDNMPIDQLWQMLDWVGLETQKQNLTVQERLNYLCDEISRQVIAAQEEE
jgi:hypothetical protein